MHNPLIGRPVLDEMDFVASQHLDSVLEKFHLHGFSHIGEHLLNMSMQTLDALSNLLLMPADIPEFIEDLPDVLTLANKKSEASGADCCPHTSIQGGNRSKRCPQTLIHRLHKLPPTPTENTFSDI
jgi:hypothetical protein